MPSAAARAGSRATLLIVVATTILLITMGARQSAGLFVLPIVSTTGLGIAAVSLALAVGQLVWGVAQPIFGALADQHGAHRMIIFGACLLALGSVLTTFVTSELGLLLTLGVLSAAGAAAGSFSILFAATAKALAPERRSLAAGYINAGGSMGQVLFAPLVQLLIGAWGWVAAMYAMAASALLTIPLARSFRSSEGHSTAGTAEAPRPADAPAATGLREQLRIALRDRSYLYLNAGFFTCGFHIGFLVTHFPGDLQMCGLPATVAANSLALIGLFNVAGSLGAGWLGQRHRMKNVLAGVYAVRAVLVAIYLVMPKTALNVYIFSGGLGLTWLATIPPTSGIIGKLFGVRYLATLFGVALLTHQIGAFLGAGLGGLAVAGAGTYQWIWYADLALALAAALLNLPIREPKPLPQPALAS